MQPDALHAQNEFGEISFPEASPVCTRLRKINLIVVIQQMVVVPFAAAVTLVFGIVQGRECSGIQVVL